MVDDGNSLGDHGCRDVPDRTRIVQSDERAGSLNWNTIRVLPLPAIGCAGEALMSCSARERAFRRYGFGRPCPLPIYEVERFENSAQRRRLSVKPASPASGE